MHQVSEARYQLPIEHSPMMDKQEDCRADGNIIVTSIIIITMIIIAMPSLSPLSAACHSRRRRPSAIVSLVSSAVLLDDLGTVGPALAMMSQETVLPCTAPLHHSRLPWCVGAWCPPPLRCVALRLRCLLCSLAGGASQNQFDRPPPAAFHSHSPFCIVIL